MYKLQNFHHYLNEARFRVSPIQIELKDKYEKEIQALTLIDSGKAIEINMIRIHNSFRGQGIATEILQRICDYADDFEKILHLTPTDEFGSNKKKLTEFYKRFGFVMNAGKNKVSRFKDTMIRFPE